MVPASPSPELSPDPRRRTPLQRGKPWRWPMGLLVGACFGLGYGVTQRLLRFDVVIPWQGSQPFGVKPFPGTALKGLRERYGDNPMEIRGDLDLLDQERQKQKEAKELAAREAELKRREAEEQALQRQEEESAPVEDAQRESEPPIPEPPAVGPIEAPGTQPVAPTPQPAPPAPQP